MLLEYSRLFRLIKCVPMTRTVMNVRILKTIKKRLEISTHLIPKYTIEPKRKTKKQLPIHVGIFREKKWEKIEDRWWPLVAIYATRRA